MEWLAPLAKIIPQRHWVHVDVGANKGYGVASFLRLLTGEGPEPRKIFNDLYKRYWLEGDRRMYGGRVRAAMDTWKAKVYCGFCCDCLDHVRPLLRQHQASSVDVYAIDLQPSTAQWLKILFDEEPRVKVMNVGIAKEKRKIQLLAEGVGHEQSSVAMVATAKTNDTAVEVSIMALSDVVPLTTHIDFLSTDTEGFDYEVFSGARKFFEQKKVSVYVFEVHLEKAPRKTLLSDFLSELDMLGYDCVMPTQRTRRDTHLKNVHVPMYAPVGNCRGAALERHIGWANFLCYDASNHTLQQVFGQLAKDDRPVWEHVPAKCWIPKTIHDKR